VMNQQLIRAASSIAPRTLERKLTVGGKIMTLGVLLNDYVDHLLDHLRRIGVDFAPRL
jgi:hypothetical protein